MTNRLFRLQWLKMSWVCAAVLASTLGLADDEREHGIARVPLANGPFRFDTAEQHDIRVDVVIRGLDHPFSLAFLPDGDALVVERGKSLRRIRGITSTHPEVIATAIAGVPTFNDYPGKTVDDMVGIQDVIVHPDFLHNHLVYFTYNRPGCSSAKETTKLEKQCFVFALARAQLQDGKLVNTKDVLAGEPIADTGGSRMVFGKDKMLYITIGAASLDDTGQPADKLDSLYGKVLRIKDDGSIPDDNPFVKTPGARGEIYTLGHRDHAGIALHPTGTLVSSEYGPQGGDKINRLLPGHNYGWPTYSYGRDYDGLPRYLLPVGADDEQTLVVWNPSISPSGIAFYTADRFPAWRGNLFAAGLRRGQLEHTGTLERIVFNDQLQELRRESLLTELHQRMRDVRQGPDGLLYVLTDEDDGALLRLSPVSPTHPVTTKNH